MARLTAAPPAAWLLALLGLGCAPMPADLESSGPIRAPIIFGSAPLNPTDRAIVALMTLQTNADGSWSAAPFCSGTLIAPRIVLTAAHCVPSSFATNGAVFFGDELRAPLATAGTTVRVTSIQVHPSYNAAAATFDIALLELESSPADVRPIPALPSALGMTAGADTGASVRTVGFGLTEEVFQGTAPRQLRTKRQVNVPVAFVCTNESGCDGLPPRSFVYDHADGGPCNGDSGGPALIRRNGREFVAGVNSTINAPRFGTTTDPDCVNANYGVETLVSSFSSFITSFVASRGLPADPCASSQDDCDDHVTCTSAPGWFACGSCGPGLNDPTGEGRTCLDVDECAASNALCPLGQACTNVEGGYRCDACGPGYFISGTGACQDANECASGAARCDPRVSCTNTPGSYRCGACPTGTVDSRGDGTLCSAATDPTNAPTHQLVAGEGPVTEIAGAASCRASSPGLGAAMSLLLALLARRRRRRY